MRYEPAAPVDLPDVITFDQALERFPCPDCSEFIGERFADRSPGYRKSGHAFS